MKILAFNFFVLSSLSAFAQEPNKSNMPDTPVWIMNEYTNTDGDITTQKLKQTFYVHPLIRKNQKSKTSLNLDLDRASDQPMIDLMTPGTGLVLEPWRDEIGQIISQMPCQDSLVIKSNTEPVSDIDRVIPNAKDKRRIRRIQVDGCFEESPEDCFLDARVGGYTDFDYGDLKVFFLNCKNAMIKAVNEGKDLAKSRDTSGKKKQQDARHQDEGR